MTEIPVVLAKLTGNIHGFVTLGSDYEPIIVINDDLSPQQKRKTYKHELNHILHEDMTNETYIEYGDK